MKKPRKSHNEYPITELMSEESVQTLDIAKIMARKSNPYFMRYIDGVLYNENEYQDWLERGGAAGSR